MAYVFKNIYLQKGQDKERKVSLTNSAGTIRYKYAKEKNQIPYSYYTQKLTQNDPQIEPNS